MIRKHPESDSNCNIDLVLSNSAKMRHLFPMRNSFVSSLRAGCATQAAMNGVNERDILRQTGHGSSVMLAKYIRIGQMFTHNANAAAAVSLGI